MLRLLTYSVLTAWLKIAWSTWILAQTDPGLLTGLGLRSGKKVPDIWDWDILDFPGSIATGYRLKLKEVLFESTAAYRCSSLSKTLLYIFIALSHCKNSHRDSIEILIDPYCLQLTGSADVELRRLQIWQGDTSRRESSTTRFNVSYSQPKKPESAIPTISTVWLWFEYTRSWSYTGAKDQWSALLNASLVFISLWLYFIDSHLKARASSMHRHTYLYPHSNILA